MHALPAKLRHATVILALPAVLAACDDEDPTGPDDGTARGTVSAAIEDEGAAAQAASAAAVQSAVSGSMSGTARAFIYSDADGWTSVGTRSGATLELQGSDTATVATNDQVEAGTYTRVRLVLDGFDAEVDAGVVVGGVALDTEVVVEMGGADGQVEIVKDVAPFQVTTDGTLHIRFDLNSETWLDAQAVESEIAADADIEAATTAEVVSG